MGAVAGRVGAGIPENGSCGLSGCYANRLMLRLILAVAAGFVTMSVLVLATEFALLRFSFRSVEILGARCPRRICWPMESAACSTP